MFKSIRTDIEQLDTEIGYLNADWRIAEHRLLQFYVKVMPKLIDVERCSIFVADRESDDLWLHAATGLRERSIEVDKVSESIVGEAVKNKAMVYRDKLDKEDGANQTVDTMTGFVPRDVMCVPIWSLDGKQVTGAVQLLNRDQGKPYSDADVALIEEMLYYLELSIENIYFQQEASGVLGRTYRLLRNTTIVAVLAFFAVVVAFSIYWTVFFLLG